MGKNHPNVDKYVESRVRALESLLLEKGILPADAVDRVIQRFEADTGPLIGARAVARAWRDPDYKRRLLEEPPPARMLVSVSYWMTSVTTPEPTVRPPSRIAKRRPASMAIGWISSISIWTLSPGMTISTPSGRFATPVTSVVRK